LEADAKLFNRLYNSEGDAHREFCAIFGPKRRSSEVRKRRGSSTVPGWACVRWRARWHRTAPYPNSCPSSMEHRGQDRNVWRESEPCGSENHDQVRISPRIVSTAHQLRTRIWRRDTTCRDAGFIFRRDWLRGKDLIVQRVRARQDTRLSKILLVALMAFIEARICEASADREIRAQTRYTGTTMIRAASPAR
jgi:hypothetical protein